MTALGEPGSAWPRGRRRSGCPAGGGTAGGRGRLNAAQSSRQRAPRGPAAAGHRAPDGRRGRLPALVGAFRPGRYGHLRDPGRDRRRRRRGRAQPARRGRTGAPRRPPGPESRGLPAVPHGATPALHEERPRRRPGAASSGPWRSTRRTPRRGSALAEVEGPRGDLRLEADRGGVHGAREAALATGGPPAGRDRRRPATSRACSPFGERRWADADASRWPGRSEVEPGDVRGPLLARDAVQCIRGRTEDALETLSSTPAGSIRSRPYPYAHDRIRAFSRAGGGQPRPNAVLEQALAFDAGQQSSRSGCRARRTSRSGGSTERDRTSRTGAHPVASRRLHLRRARLGARGGGPDRRGAPGSRGPAGSARAGARRSSRRRGFSPRWARWTARSRCSTGTCGEKRPPRDLHGPAGLRPAARRPALRGVRREAQIAVGRDAVTLASGSRLGPYEILSLLGKGGIGGGLSGERPSPRSRGSR